MGKKRLKKILLDVESEFGASGLSNGYYADYASEVARRYATKPKVVASFLLPATKPLVQNLICVDEDGVVRALDQDGSWKIYAEGI